MSIDWMSQAQAMRPELVERRRDFHRHPELAFQELRTSGIVAKALNELGLEVITGVGKTGVVAILEGDHEGPTVFVRCDMDALPITEANVTDYVSETPGKMHACGHDGHMAIGLAVAKLLSQHRERDGWAGQVSVSTRRRSRQWRTSYDRRWRIEKPKSRSQFRFAPVERIARRGGRNHGWTDDGRRGRIQNRHPWQRRSLPRPNKRAIRCSRAQIISALQTDGQPQRERPRYRCRVDEHVSRGRSQQRDPFRSAVGRHFPYLPREIHDLVGAVCAKS